MAAEKKTLYSRILLLLYIAAMLFLCFGKFENLPETPSFLPIGADKIVHFCMFLPFVPLFVLAFVQKRGKWWIILLFAILGVCFAALTEVGQGMTDYRSQDIFDFIADSTGLITGALLSTIFKK